jgi:hypothetical protein
MATINTHDQSDKNLCLLLSTASKTSVAIELAKRLKVKLSVQILAQFIEA